MKTGGSAFPVLEKDVDYNGAPFLYCDGEGMSLRDYFAGQVLSALCVPPVRTNDIDWIAHTSYLIADAMLTEREKENG